MVLPRYLPTFGFGWQQDQESPIEPPFGMLAPSASDIHYAQASGRTQYDPRTGLLPGGLLPGITRGVPQSYPGTIQPGQSPRTGTQARVRPQLRQAARIPPTASDLARVEEAMNDPTWAIARAVDALRRQQRSGEILRPAPIPDKKNESGPWLPKSAAPYTSLHYSDPSKPGKGTASPVDSREKSKVGANYPSERGVGFLPYAEVTSPGNPGDIGTEIKAGGGMIARGSNTRLGLGAYGSWKKTKDGWEFTPPTVRFGFNEKGGPDFSLEADLQDPAIRFRLGLPF